MKYLKITIFYLQFVSHLLLCEFYFFYIHFKVRVGIPKGLPVFSFKINNLQAN